MKWIICLLAAIGCGSALAGDMANDNLTINTLDMTFPVVIEIDSGTKDAVEKLVYGKSDGAQPTFKLAPGKHTLNVRQGRLAFPQDATLTVKNDGKTAFVKRLVDHAYTIDVGPKTEVSLTLHTPLEAYNTHVSTFKGVPLVIVWHRPYWFFDLERPWTAKEAYPNTAMFFADTKAWGADKVIDDLVEATVKHVVDGKMKEQLGDTRANCHVSVMFALQADGSLSPAIAKLPPADLKKELKAKLLDMHGSMIKTNCYRTWTKGDLDQLRGGGLMPPDMFKGQPRVHMTLEQGIDLAKPLLGRWNKETGLKK
jgi:hypothetical protein